MSPRKTRKGKHIAKMRLVKQQSTSDVTKQQDNLSTLSRPRSGSDEMELEPSTSGRSMSMPLSVDQPSTSKQEDDNDSPTQIEPLSRSHQKKILCEKYDVYSLVEFKDNDSDTNRPTTTTVTTDDPTTAENIIVNLNSLNKFINQFKCLLCNKSRTMYSEICYTQGLANQIDVRCTSCAESVCKWWTSETSGTGRSQFYTINRDTVFASLSTGMGAEKSKSIFEKLNLSAMHHQTFQTHAEAIYNLNDEVRQVIFQKSAEIVRKEHLALAGADQNCSEPLNISVSYDGSWLTRGHTSLIGLGCVIDCLTGLVIDGHVMNSYCQVCRRIAQIPQDDERKRKEDHHAGSGSCSANFHGKFFKIIITNNLLLL